jgi:hypothetical protein
MVAVATVTDDGGRVSSRDGLPDPQAATSRRASAAAGQPVGARIGEL